MAQLRAATGRHPGDTRLRALVGELLVTSPDFAAWWSQHDVAVACHPHKRVADAHAGELRFWHETLELPGDGLQLVVYLPADEATAAACAGLAAGRARPPGEPAPRRLRAIDG